MKYTLRWEVQQDAGDNFIAILETFPFCQTNSRHVVFVLRKLANTGMIKCSQNPKAVLVSVVEYPVIQF